MNWRTVGELIDNHQRELHRVAQRGGGLPRAFTLQERAAVDQKVETRALHRIGNGDTVWFLTAWIVTFLLCDGFLWSGHRPGPRIVGLSLVTAAAVYYGFTVWGMPWLIGFAQRFEMSCSAHEEQPQ